MSINSNIGISLKTSYSRTDIRNDSGRELEKWAEMKNSCNIGVLPNFVGMGIIRIIKQTNNFFFLILSLASVATY